MRLMLIIAMLSVVATVNSPFNAAAASKGCTDQAVIDQVSADLRAVTATVDDVIGVFEPQQTASAATPDATPNAIGTPTFPADFRSQVMQGLLAVVALRQKYEDLDVPDSCAEALSTSETLLANDADLLVFALAAIDNPTEANVARIATQSQRIDDLINQVSDALHVDFLSQGIPATPAPTGEAAN